MPKTITYIIVTGLFLYFNRCFYYKDYSFFLPAETWIFLAVLLFCKYSMGSNGLYRPMELPLWLVFFIAPMFSFIPCELFHGQPIFLSFISVINFGCSVVIYWVLHKLRAEPNDIMKVLIILAIIWCLIEIIQQVTYPVYLFGSRIDENGIHGLDNRNGFWRFMVQPWFVGYMVGIYAWFRYLKEYKISKFVLFAVCAVGIYLYLTRVVLVSFLVITIISYLYLTRKDLKSIYNSIILISLISLSIIANFDAFFSYFFELSQDQMTSFEDDIRSSAIYFYGIDYFPSYWCNLFGNGRPSMESAYGAEIVRYQEDFGLWRADIGLIGDYNLYGVFFVCCFIFFFYKLFSIKKYISPYISFCFLGLLLNSYIMSPFTVGTQTFLVAILCYMTDRSYERNITEQIVS